MLRLLSSVLAIAAFLGVPCQSYAQANEIDPASIYYAFTEDSTISCLFDDGRMSFIPMPRQLIKMASRGWKDQTDLYNALSDLQSRIDRYDGTKNDNNLLKLRRLYRKAKRLMGLDDKIRARCIRTLLRDSDQNDPNEESPSDRDDQKPKDDDDSSQDDPNDTPTDQNPPKDPSGDTPSTPPNSDPKDPNGDRDSKPKPKPTATPTPLPPQKPKVPKETPTPTPRPTITPTPTPRPQLPPAAKPLRTLVQLLATPSRSENVEVGEVVKVEIVGVYDDGFRERLNYIVPFNTSGGVDPLSVTLKSSESSYTRNFCATEIKNDAVFRKKYTYLNQTAEISISFRKSADGKVSDCASLPIKPSVEKFWFESTRTGTLRPGDMIGFHTYAVMSDGEKIHFPENFVSWQMSGPLSSGSLHSRGNYLCYRKIQLTPSLKVSATLRTTPPFTQSMEFPLEGNVDDPFVECSEPFPLAW